jgi:hypothetical protein
MLTMKVVACVARVYGSHDFFGSEPRTPVSGTPIEVPDFPLPGDVARVHLGTPSDAVLEAHRRSRAIAIAGMEGFFGTARRGDRRESIRELLNQSNFEPTGVEADFYVSIIVERSVEVDDAYIKDDEFVWLDPKELMRLEREVQAETTPALDRLSICAASVLGWGFLAFVVVRDYPLFFAEGRKAFGAPRATLGGAAVQLQRPIEALDVTRLRKLLMVATRPLTPDWLTGVARWVQAAAIETDQVKRFLWSFLALETLCHKLGERLYAATLDQLTAKTAAVPGAARDVFGRPWNELRSLRERFVVVAVTLSPATLDEDLAEFQAAKSSRDDLAHGRYVDGEPLPTYRVEALISRFVELGLRNAPSADR